MFFLECGSVVKSWNAQRFRFGGLEGIFAGELERSIASAMFLLSSIKLGFFLLRRSLYSAHIYRRDWDWEWRVFTVELGCAGDRDVLARWIWKTNMLR